MPSLDDVAEDSVAYVINEFLEPGEEESREISASEFADQIGYDPGLISRAWKAAALDGYDVQVERVDRENNRITWRVSYEPDSDAIPVYTGPERDPGRGRWTGVRQRLQEYGVTVERPDILKPEYTDVYADVLDRLRDTEQEDMAVIRAIADHDRMREKYDSVQARFRHASERLNELKEGVKEVREYRKQLGQATKVLLRLE